MATLDKLKRRLLTIPTDFTYDELCRLLLALGFQQSNRGATSGCRVSFYREQDGAMIQLHRPHPEKEICIAAIKALVKKLRELGDLDD